MVFCRMMLFSLSICFLGSCGKHPTPTDKGRSQALEPKKLKVMSFNIWGAGVDPRYQNTLVVLKQTRADIIALQESAGAIDRFAADLGYYGSPASDIISRFPIVREYQQPGLRAYGVRVQLPDSHRTIVIFNSHLSPFPYGPYEVRDGRQPKEAARKLEMEQALAFIETHLNDGDEVLFLGDHNTVSHIDWRGKGYDWPISLALAEAGFVDSYREVFADPVQHPGFTWSPGYPGRPANDTNDRIDYIYYKRVVLRALASETLDHHNFSSWPSDHRAVVSTFALAASTNY